jgi:hypothetical protein
MKTDDFKKLILAGRGSWIMGGVLFATGTIIITFGNSATAVVAPADLAQKNSAGRVISSFLHGEQDDVANISRTLDETDELLNKCTAPAAPMQVPLGQIRNDPFCFNSGAARGREDAGTMENNDGDRVALLQALGKIQLQSICGSGDQLACMIDNHLYHEGEQVQCFTVERIGQTSVVIRSGGYRFELKIAG